MTAAPGRERQQLSTAGKDGENRQKSGQRRLEKVKAAGMKGGMNSERRRSVCESWKFPLARWLVRKTSVLYVLDVVTLNKSNGKTHKKKLSVSNLRSHFLPQVRGYYLRHTHGKNPTVYTFPGKVFGVANGEGCVDCFRFLDASNRKQMSEVTTASKRASAQTKGQQWDSTQVKSLSWTWPFHAGAVLRRATRRAR